MADEKLPKSDNVPPGPPSPKPVPAFSQDVIYAGAPMAAAHSDPIAPAAAPPPPPAPAVRHDPVTPAEPQVAPAKTETVTKRGAEGQLRTEVIQFFSWLAGVFLILACGWGLIAFCCYVPRWFHLHIPVELAAGIGMLGSFGLLFLLEKNLWLSRFLGIRLGPHSTHLTETLFFFFTGILGLLLRSSDKPAPVAARPQMNDGTREIVETVVFVVVLVLLLKTFLVEAFVIPTGSMADTLLGYHKEYTCDKCQYRFVVNCSAEAEPQANRDPAPVVGGVCPNCRAINIRK